jgi:hypothetical protein
LGHCLFQVSWLRRRCRRLGKQKQALLVQRQFGGFLNGVGRSPLESRLTQNGVGRSPFRKSVDARSWCLSGVGSGASVRSWFGRKVGHERESGAQPCFSWCTLPWTHLRSAQFRRNCCTFQKRTLAFSSVWNRTDGSNSRSAERSVAERFSLSSWVLVRRCVEATSWTQC